MKSEPLTPSGRTARDWIALETSHCRSGRLPASTDIDLETYCAQIGECDAKKSEALVALGVADPLLTLRALLFRGRLREARQLVKQLKRTALGDQTELIEAVLEEARLCAFEGDWKGAYSCADEGLALRPAGVTQLTLHQVRALASFELGRMVAAAEDLRRIESLAVLYPNSISAFYARILGARIRARDRGVAEGRELLSPLWCELVASGNIDQFQAILRVELDLRRMEGKPHHRHALAALRLAERMGEDLYVALAHFDCAVAHPSLGRKFSGELEQENSRFQRLRRLRREVSGGPVASTSGALAREFLARHRQSDRRGTLAPSILAPARSLVLLEQKIVLHFRPWRVLSLGAHPRAFTALRYLKTGRASKAGLFRAVWGNQKYSPLLHDNTVASLLHRMKKNLGLVIKTDGDLLVLNDTLVVP